MKIISIGEVLWDVIGETEHLGGAPFNFAAHCKNLGHDVCFISAVGTDLRGQRVLERMAEIGLSTSYVTRVKDQPTGLVTVTLDSTGQPAFVIHRLAAYDFPRLDKSQMDALFHPAPDWIYYGTLQQTSPTAQKLTMQLLELAAGAHRFYDVNLRVNSYTPALVRECMSKATIVKLNEDEVLRVTEMLGQKRVSLEEFCRSNARDFGLEAVCVTRGAQGCALLIHDEFLISPGYPMKVADTVGAGDSFAAAFVHGWASGWSPPQIADFANRVGALVASRPGAIPRWTVNEALELATRSVS